MSENIKEMTKLQKIEYLYDLVKQHVNYYGLQHDEPLFLLFKDSGGNPYTVDTINKALFTELHWMRSGNTSTVLTLNFYNEVYKIVKQTDRLIEQERDKYAVQ